MSLGEQLAQGITKLGIHVAPETQRQLLDYLNLLIKWNRIHNLTAVREAPQMVSSHLLDCLAVAPHLQASKVLDVGSGAGLPGIPLALIWPQAHVTLLDSNHKKAAFLRQATIELGLKNTQVVCERVETWQAAGVFDLVISRAFSDLSEFVRLAGRLCDANGTVAAMKGVYPDEELAQSFPAFKLRGVVPLQVPGVRAKRHLVLLSPQR
jgi:16S rRNA (guanine527-N7)-methyltransferase